MLADALGNPLGFILTSGERGDAPQAAALLAGREGTGIKAALFDRGYDGAGPREAIAALGAEAVIPRTDPRRRPIVHDALLYGARHLIENLFAKLKAWRAVATRYDKLARNYAGMITLACIMVWLA